MGAWARRTIRAVTYAFIAACVFDLVLAVMLARTARAFEREHYAHLDELASMRQEALKERAELLNRIQRPELLPAREMSPEQVQQARQAQERQAARQKALASVGTIAPPPSPNGQIPE